MSAALSAGCGAEAGRHDRAFQVAVAFSGGAGAISVAVRPSDTIGDIKARVAACVGVPQTQQRLAFAGRDLLDGRRADECGLRDDALLSLVSRRRGGGGCCPARAQVVPDDALREEFDAFRKRVEDTNTKHTEEFARVTERLQSLADEISKLHACGAPEAPAQDMSKLRQVACSAPEAPAQDMSKLRQISNSTSDLPRLDEQLEIGNVVEGEIGRLRDDLNHFEVEIDKLREESKTGMDQAVRDCHREIEDVRAEIHRLRRDGCETEAEQFHESSSAETRAASDEDVEETETSTTPQTYIEEIRFVAELSALRQEIKTSIETLGTEIRSEVMVAEGALSKEVSEKLETLKEQLTDKIDAVHTLCHEVTDEMQIKVADLEKDVQERLKKDSHQTMRDERKDFIQRVDKQSVFDTIRRLGRKADCRVEWTRTLSQELLGACSQGYARPFHLSLVKLALYRRADPCKRINGHSMLIQVLKHREEGDILRTSVQVARALMKAGAKLDEDELQTLGEAWAEERGREWDLQQLVYDFADSNPTVQRRWEKRVRWTSIRQQPRETWKRHPYHLSGITLRQLWDVYEDHREWIEAEEYCKFKRRVAKRSMHDIVKKVILPRTDRQKSSYSDLLPPRQIDAFVSHTWGEEFSDFVSSLELYVKKTKPTDDEASFAKFKFWVCSFVINQHGLEGINGDVAETAFTKALAGCDRVVAALDNEASMLTRVWCVYELFYSVQMRKKIDFASPDGLLSSTRKFTQYQRSALQALSVFDGERAEASVEKDREVIFDAVRSAPGGFDYVNNRVRSLVSLLYRLGDSEKETIDPISGRRIDITTETVPFRLRLGDETLDVQEFIERRCCMPGKRLFLVGEAGSGKTVLSKQIVYHISAASERKATLVARIPACDLHDCSGDFLLDWIEKNFGRDNFDMNIFSDPAKFSYENTLVVLDGLHEADEKVLAVLEWLGRWLDEGKDSRSAIVTCCSEDFLQTLAEDGIDDGRAVHVIETFERFAIEDFCLADAAKLFRLRFPDATLASTHDVERSLEPFSSSPLLKRPLMCSMLVELLSRDGASQRFAKLNIAALYLQFFQMMTLPFRRAEKAGLYDAVARLHGKSSRLIGFSDLPKDIAMAARVGKLPLLQRVRRGFEVLQQSFVDFAFACRVCRAECGEVCPKASLEACRDDKHIGLLLDDMVPREAWADPDGCCSRPLCFNLMLRRGGREIRLGSIEGILKMDLGWGDCRLAGRGSWRLRAEPEHALEVRLEGLVSKPDGRGAWTWEMKVWVAGFELLRLTFEGLSLQDLLNSKVEIGGGKRYAGELVDTAALPSLAEACLILSEFEAIAKLEQEARRKHIHEVQAKIEAQASAQGRSPPGERNTNGQGPEARAHQTKPQPVEVDKALAAELKALENVPKGDWDTHRILRDAYKSCFAAAVATGACDALVEPAFARAWADLADADGEDSGALGLPAKSCFERALRCDPECATPWYRLKRLGGGSVGGKTFSAKACSEKALEYGCNSSELWADLGDSGGGTIGMESCTAKQCFERALGCDASYAHAWSALAGVGGGTVQGLVYSVVACYEQALFCDARLVAVWMKLGRAGGGRVGGTQYDRGACFKVVLGLTPKDGEAWGELGREGGGEVRGSYYAAKECFEQAVHLDRRNIDWWLGLGEHGGGSVDGVDFSPKECFVTALSIDAGSTAAWCGLGGAGGGKANGVEHDVASCFENALSSYRDVGPSEMATKSLALAWCGLGRLAGASAGGGRSKRACYEAVLRYDPKSAEAWATLGLLGGVRMSGRQYSRQECLEISLMLDGSDTCVWNNLGALGGGTVGEQAFDTAACYRRALSLDPSRPRTWCNLGFIISAGAHDADFTAKDCFEKTLNLDSGIAKAWVGLGYWGDGGVVRGRSYDAKQCYEQALAHDRNDASAWLNLGIAGGGVAAGSEYRERQCYEQVLRCDAGCAKAWRYLGELGGGEVSGELYDENACYQQAELCSAGPDEAAQLDE